MYFGAVVAHIDRLDFMQCCNDCGSVAWPCVTAWEQAANSDSGDDASARESGQDCRIGQHRGVPRQLHSEVRIGRLQPGEDARISQTGGHQKEDSEDRKESPA